MPFTQREIDEVTMAPCKLEGLCDGSCRDYCKILGVSAPLLGCDLPRQLAPKSKLTALLEALGLQLRL